MAVSTSIVEVAERLSAAFGVELRADQVAHHGGIFDAVRPAGMELGPGFSILVARTPRQVEASFRADNFAGGLIRKLSEAGEVARERFEQSIARAINDGLAVNLSVNGEDMDAMWHSSEAWRLVEIDVSVRLARGIPVIEAEVACARECLSAVFALLESDDDDDVLGQFEGGTRHSQATRYERSPVNRAACIEHFGAKCIVCGFDFLEVYGSLGRGFIEVHHIEQVSAMSVRARLDPRKDLVPLCSNCHSMVHRLDPPLGPEDLRETLSKTKKE
jgi:5-methylcytosine-specific restriction enzyme A